MRCEPEWTRGYEPSRHVIITDVTCERAQLALLKIAGTLWYRRMFKAIALTFGPNAFYVKDACWREGVTKAWDVEEDDINFDEIEQVSALWDGTGDSAALRCYRKARLHGIRAHIWTPESTQLPLL